MNRSESGSLAAARRSPPRMWSASHGTGRTGSPVPNGSNGGSIDIPAGSNGVLQKFGTLTLSAVFLTARIQNRYLDDYKIQGLHLSSDWTTRSVRLCLHRSTTRPFIDFYSCVKIPGHQDGASSELHPTRRSNHAAQIGERRTAGDPYGNGWPAHCYTLTRATKDAS